MAGTQLEGARFGLSLLQYVYEVGRTSAHALWSHPLGLISLHTFSVPRSHSGLESLARSGQFVTSEQTSDTRIRLFSTDEYLDLDVEELWGEFADIPTPPPCLAARHGRLLYLLHGFVGAA